MHLATCILHSSHKLVCDAQAAAQQRHAEQSVRRQAKEDAKNRRKRRQDDVPAAATADAAAAEQQKDEEQGEEDGDEEDVQHDDLDLLPDDVIEAIAQGGDRRPLERRIISEQLRAAGAEHTKKKQRKKELGADRKVGPVVVKVLNSVDARKPSAAAEAFLRERFGQVKRSADMLRPTQVGGVFLYGPKPV
jgi:hypothetical protein